MKKNHGRTLLVAALALSIVLSVTGGTIAWFTDEVTSASNIIKSGTLDVEMSWADGKEDPVTAQWTDASSGYIFNYDKWEPGYTEIRHILIENVGTLAFKYQMNIEANGEVSELADVIDVYFIDPAQQIASRDALSAAPIGVLSDVLAGMPVNTIGHLEAGKNATVTIALKMQESAGNEYQGKAIGSDFAIKLYATQDTVESDSFDEQYDADTPFVAEIIKVDPTNIQAYLNGEHGSLENKRVVLTKGDYGMLNLGVATKYSGSNTLYTCENHNYTTDDGEAYRQHKGESVYHAPGRFHTTLKNVVFSAEEGVKVDGLLITSGHNYSNPDNKVLDNNEQYYQTHTISNITFENIDFTGKVDINTSMPETVIDGVSFIGCTFTTDGTNSNNGAALRFYNESNNGQVKNLKVSGCSFNNCYQGVYTNNVNGISVTGSTFDTTGHNAIAVQSSVHGAVDHKAVVIKNNSFKNIGDRIIRFGDIGGDSQITIQNNTAVNSGDEEGEVIKATTIAQGASVTAKENNWGENKKVANSEFADQ